MAAPEYVPVPTTDKARWYESPDHAPDAWTNDRPADFNGRQPQGKYLGFQGPDQGYGLVLANRFRSRLALAAAEHEDDAVSGCLGIALRRASLYGRAPVVHDLTIAFTIWGYLDPSAPADLVEKRGAAFAQVAHAHHYFERRQLVDQVPEATLRMTPEQVKSAYPARWRELVGVSRG